MKILKRGKTLEPLEIAVTCKLCEEQLLLTDPKEMFYKTYVDNAGYDAKSYHFICPHCNYENEIPIGRIGKDAKLRIQPRV